MNRQQYMRPAHARSLDLVWYSLKRCFCCCFWPKKSERSKGEYELVSLDERRHPNGNGHSQSSSSSSSEDDEEMKRFESIESKDIESPAKVLKSATQKSKKKINSKASPEPIIRPTENPALASLSAFLSTPAKIPNDKLKINPPPTDYYYSARQAAEARRAAAMTDQSTDEFVYLERDFDVDAFYEANVRSPVDPPKSYKDEVEEAKSTRTDRIIKESDFDLDSMMTELEGI